MKNVVLFALAFVWTATAVTAQKYFTREGNISFFSDAPLEKIEANNKTATSVLDVATGQMEFAVLIKAFQFEKALMQEHFNENYMESSKYPKSTFKGKIVNLDQVNFTKDGEYIAKVKGDLTIHGVTKAVETEGAIKVSGGKISAVSSFEVAVADYNITIPAVVRDNIAKTVRIDVNINYMPLEEKASSSKK
jgi:hypothetical protein